MSWLNTSLNKLTSLAQEVLAETAGPGDLDCGTLEEAAGNEPATNATGTLAEQLAMAHHKNGDLQLLCDEQERKIGELNAELLQLKAQTNPKPTTQSEHALEDSWCWETECAADSGVTEGNEQATLATTTAENKRLLLAVDELREQHAAALELVAQLERQCKEKDDFIATLQRSSKAVAPGTLKYESNDTTPDSSSSSSTTSNSGSKRTDDEFIVIPSGGAASATPSKEQSQSPTPSPIFEVGTTADIDLSKELEEFQSNVDELSRNVRAEDEAARRYRELEARLLLSEQEKEKLQEEAHRLRVELGCQRQNENVNNQLLLLNTGAEHEQKLRALEDENESLREQLSQSLSPRKITDLDDNDDNDAPPSALAVESTTATVAIELSELLRLYADHVERRATSGLARQTYNMLAQSNVDTTLHFEQFVAMQMERLDDAEKQWHEELESLRVENQQLVMQCHDLMSERSQMFREIENLKRNKLDPIDEQHEENILRLEQQTEAYSKQIKQLEDDKIDLEERLMLQSEAQISNDEQFQRSVAELNEQHAQNILRLEQQAEAYSKQIKQLEEDKVDLEERLMFHSEAQISNDEHLQRTVAELNEQHAQNILRLEQQAEAYSKQIKQLEEDKVDLEERLMLHSEAQISNDEHLQRTIGELNGEVLLREALVEGANDKLAKTATDLAECQRAKFALMQRVEELEKALLDQAAESKSTAQEQAYEAELLTVQQAKDQLVVQLESLLAERETHAQTMAKLREERDIIDGARADAEAAKKRLHDELEKAKLAAQLMVDDEPCKDCLQHEQHAHELRAEVKPLQAECSAHVERTREFEELETAHLALRNEFKQQRRDLERLTQHLVEKETQHTEEMIALHEQLQLANDKVKQLDQQCQKSSNLYTSSSIRANQQAETLNAQRALFVKERQELLERLSACEDRELRSQAALTNLQCALEQFQNGKQKEIDAVLAQSRRDMDAQLAALEKLKHTLHTMEAECAAQRQALAIKDEQLVNMKLVEKRHASAKEQIVDLEKRLHELTAKCNDLDNSDKIDKNLMKSFLIGWLSLPAGSADKQQIMRMIGDLLSFTELDALKAGLISKQQQQQQAGWFSSLLGVGQGQASGNAEQLLNDLKTIYKAHLQQPPAAVQEKPAVSTQHQQTPTPTPTPSLKHVPMQPFVNDDENNFAPQRNSSTILKDILNDS